MVVVVLAVMIEVVVAAEGGNRGKNSSDSGCKIVL